MSTATAARTTNSASESDAVIQELKTQLQEDEVLSKLLVDSLEKAHKKAKSTLDPGLYKHLEWPTSPKTYLAYLHAFARWIPREDPESYWKVPDSPQYNRFYTQEILDRLCHFYWLIDRPVKDPNSTSKITLQSYVNPTSQWSFGGWLDEFAQAWGSFLSTPESLTPDTLESFKNDPGYNFEDSSDYEKDWQSFNDFFKRELNSPRPIGSGSDVVAVMPADSTFKATDAIGKDGSIPADDSGLTVKHTHTFTNVDDLLGHSQFAPHFHGGTYVHYFLGPFDYHRFHSPVSGTIEQSEVVQGLAYLNVDIEDGQFDAPDDAKDGYEARQTRGILVIRTSDDRWVAVIPVGMAQVSSATMTVQTGNAIQAGDEFGYFMFGGSDIILLFSEPSDELEIIRVNHGPNNNPDKHHFLYGQVAVKKK